MRTLLLTGTAMMFMSGVALAQSAGGATGAGTSGSSSQMSPQNQPGTNVSNGSTTSKETGSTSASGMTNHSGGMTSKDHTMPHQRRSTMSKGMHNGSGTMGKSSMNHSSMGHSSMSHSSMNKTRYISHSMSGGMMPEGGSAGQYLHIAQQAVMSHNKMRAHDALGRAETDLLTNSYTQGSVNGPISTPAIKDIRGARSAVDRGQFPQASMMIHKVMTDMHGQMSGGMMHNGQGGMMDHDNDHDQSSGMMNHANGTTGMSNSGMNNSGMSNTGMSNTGMSNSGMSNGSNMKADGGTKMPGAKPEGKQNSTIHNQMTKSTNAAQ